MREIRLTQKEMETMCLIAFSNADIAQKVNASPEAIRIRLNKLYKKLNVENRTQALIVSLRLGLIDLYMLQI